MEKSSRTSLSAKIPITDKKIMVHTLITKSSRAPWNKIKPVYLETIIAKNDQTGQDGLYVRVTKTPPKEDLPTSYLGAEITYVELPEVN